MLKAQRPLTRAALGSPAERAALGGGKYYPLLTKKQRAVEIYGRRQSKARNEKVQISAYFYFFQKVNYGQGQLKFQDMNMRDPGEKDENFKAVIIAEVFGRYESHFQTD